MCSSRRFVLVFAAIIVCCCGYLSSAEADEEGGMPLAHIQFDSAGLDNSGPVHVEAT